jgi:protein dithiol oxidoreductase (disulfide-forming)
MIRLLSACLAFVLVGSPCARAAEDLTGPYLSVPGSYSFVRRAPEGRKAGKVKMLVFEDFLCSVCYQAITEIIPVLQQKYREQLEIAFIAYPLVAEESLVPAQAYALAKEMGVEKEMQQALFRTQFEEQLNVYTREGLAQAVSSIGLDPEDFLAKLNAGSGSSRVKEDVLLAESYSIDALPGIVLDGWIRVNELSQKNLETIIDGLLARKGA